MNNYAKQLGNPDKTDKFLKTHKLTHKEIEKVNRPIISKEIDQLIKTKTQKEPKYLKRKA